MDEKKEAGSQKRQEVEQVNDNAGEDQRCLE